MNIVLDDAAEINVKTKESRSVGNYQHMAYENKRWWHINAGRIMLKGDCITLMQRADPEAA